MQGGVGGRLQRAPHTQAAHAPKLTQPHLYVPTDRPTDRPTNRLPRAPQEAAEDDRLPYDAVIVGAGIQGILSLAEAVKQGFKRVIIVEKKPW